MNIKKTLLYIILAGLFASLFTPMIVTSGLFFPFITGKAFFFRVIVEVVAVCWIVLALLDKGYAPRKSWIFYSIVLFAGVMLVADIFGENPYKAIWSNYERMEGWITIAHLLLYFAVSASVLAREKLWNVFMYVSIGVSAIVSFMGLAQLLKASGSIRVDGPLGNPIYLAVYILIHIFLLLFFIFRDEKKIFKNPWHYVYSVIIVFEAYILYSTQTRGALAGLFVGFIATALCVAIAERKNRFLRLGAIGLLVLMILSLGGFYVSRDSHFVTNNPTIARFASVFTELEKIANPGEKKLARYYVWDMAIKGLKERPVLGWGQEGFNFVFNKYYDPNMYDQEQWFDRTHNVFFDWLVAGGVLGLLSYLSLFVATLYYLWRKRSSHIFSLTEKAIITGMLAGYFVHNVFVFDNLVSYIMFFAVLGFIHSRVTENDHGSVYNYRLPDAEVMKWVISPVAILVLVFGLYYVNWKPYVAASTLVDAMQQKFAKELSPTGARYLDPMQNLELYKKALSYHSLGDSEIREYLMQSAQALAKPGVPQEIQLAYLTLARNELDLQLDRSPSDTRYLLFAGSLLDSYGQSDMAQGYFHRAEKSSPTKQTVLFAVVQNAIARKSYVEALSVAKRAFESQRNFDDARRIYAVAAILNADFKLATKLLVERYGTDMIYSEQIINAYNAVGATGKSIAIIKEYLKNNPSDAQARLSLAYTYVVMGDKVSAIRELTNLKKDMPAYSDQFDAYIQGLK